MAIPINQLPSDLVWNGQLDVSNPVKRTKYEQLNKEWEQRNQPTASTFSAPIQTIDQNKLLADNAAKRSAFMTKVEGVNPALSALEGELGVTGAKDTFAKAGDVSRNVAGIVSNVAPTQQTIAKQVGISAPRLQQRIASETGKLQPMVESATQGLTAAQAGLENVLTTYGVRSNAIFKTLDIEAGLLGDEIKNSFDLFKTTTQQNLDREIANLTQTGLNDRAALDRAAKLAEAEKAASSGSLVDLGNRYALVDPVTGKEISSFAKGVAPKLAGLGDNPANI